MARKRNPINDISNLVGGWLGGRGPGTNPQVRAAMNATRAVGRVVDSATGGFGQALLSDAQRMARSGSSTPSALYKTAAVNLGAAAAGAAAAKVAGKVVQSGRVVNPVAAVTNKLTGQQIVVHGSPVSGLKQIKPQTGSNQLPEANVMFGWNPSKKGMSSQITRQAGKYTSKNQGSQVGSLYVTSIKKSEVVTPDKLLNTGQVVSSGSGRVLKEIPASGKSFRELDAELQRQLRRFGAPAKPQVSPVASAVSKTKNKLSDIALTKAQKQNLRNRRIR